MSRADRRPVIRSTARRCLVGLAIALAVSACGSGSAPSWSFAPPASTYAAPAADAPAAGGSPIDSQAATPIVVGADGDEGLDPTATYLAPSDGRVQVYADRPSILPGQPLRLHTSTTARSYSITVTREGSPTRVVFTHRGYAGHDFRKRMTISPGTNTVRANWPVSISIRTAGWKPGVYTVLARDSRGRTSGTVFVVRSPVIDPQAALFVLPVLDYQAYNGWGGHTFYTNPLSSRSFRASFDRPYNRAGGLAFFPAYDRHIVDWLERHGYPVQYTTDYDLGTNPPAVAPRVLVLGQHTEYVPKAMFDWTELHVNVLGDMNVAYLGANSYYWQVRMVPAPAGAARPLDEVCYKLAWLDPLATTAPALATVRWSEAPVARPEAGIFGASYSGIVDGGHVPHDMTVTADMPGWALAGTGWTAGTVLKGLLLGEADQAVGAFGGLSIASGTAPYLGTPANQLRADMTIRTSPAGARVFAAGTFFYGEALAGARIGVSSASFDRFTQNIFGWLGLTAAH